MHVYEALLGLEGFRISTLSVVFLMFRLSIEFE